MTFHAQTTFTIGTDIEVHRMGFGAMRITGAGIWGEPADRENAKRLLHRVLDITGTVIAIGLMAPLATAQFDSLSLVIHV